MYVPQKIFQLLHCSFSTAPKIFCPIFYICKNITIKVGYSFLDTLYVSLDEAIFYQLLHKTISRRQHSLGERSFGADFAERFVISPTICCAHE